MEALNSFLKHSPMMAYLAMMAPRLVELHRVLKPTGSLYLHCDPTASHYLKAGEVKPRIAAVEGAQVVLVALGIGAGGGVWWCEGAGPDGHTPAPQRALSRGKARR